MKYSQAEFGRVFVLRLEDGDVLHQCVEDLARKEGVKAAAVLLVGGADKGSKLIVGPREGRKTPVRPMEYILKDVHEVAGVGTIFPNERQKPVLHMHAACGRKGNTRTGCVRSGVKIWHIGEVVIFEIINSTAVRKKEDPTGFELLDPGPQQVL
ncbi:PPC domain-containing DNA-binding protein [Elusimicrobiota bacterium]